LLGAVRNFPNFSRVFWRSGAFLVINLSPLRSLFWGSPVANIRSSWLPLFVADNVASFGQKHLIQTDIARTKND